MLDDRVRRLGRGDVLAGGEPFRLVRLSERGLAALEAGDRAVTDRLVAAGLAHPVATPRPARAGEVTVVVPVLDDAARLDRALRQLQPLAGPSDVGLVVVDDGSSPAEAAAIRRAAEAVGATWLRNECPLGPGAARNRARGAVGEVELVGFLDADTVARPEWLEPLLGHFDDPAVGAVAPRVWASPGSAAPWIAGYEERHSPLDLGRRPGVVGAHRRLSYVPTAALVCRRRALDEVGWFDEALGVGEDVDLLRRLEEAGWLTRYEPAGAVQHDCRPSLRSLAAQRFAYGRSAAMLDRRHSGTVAPVEASPWSGAAAAAALGAAALRGRWRAALAAAAAGSVLVPAAILRPKLRSIGLEATGATRTSVDLVSRGAGYAVAGALVAIRRVWWPVLLGLALGRRTRRAAITLLGLSRLASLLPRPDPPAAVAVGIVDDLAYGAGAWAGCVAERSLRSLAPRRSGRLGLETVTRPGEAGE